MFLSISEVVEIKGNEKKYISENVETLGSRTKEWFKNAETGESLIFKYSRENTGEHWSEVIASYIAQCLEIPHASYAFAKLKQNVGVLSPNFVPIGCQLVMGNEMIVSVDQKYDKLKSAPADYTVQKVWQTLKNYSLKKEWRGASAENLFLQYLFLDALVGNVDRHHENWGVIVDSKGPTFSLAPTFDHASSMGRELTDTKREQKLKTRDQNFNVSYYAKKAKCHLRDSETSKKLSPCEAYLQFRELCPTGEDTHLKLLNRINEDKLAKLVREVPIDFMSSISKDFAIEFLVSCLERLRKL